jgi:hypothetical protein
LTSSRMTMGHVYIPQLLETDLSCFAALSGPETGK